MSLDIQDPNHNVCYDFVEHIIERMHEEIEATQKGEMGNFRFFHYSLLMHIILFKNIGHISPDFIEATEENGETLLVQLWTCFWQKIYLYASTIAFYNDYVFPIMNMLMDIDERVPRGVRMLIRPSTYPNEDKVLSHD